MADSRVIAKMIYVSIFCCHASCTIHLSSCKFKAFYLNFSSFQRCRKNLISISDQTGPPMDPNWQTFPVWLSRATALRSMKSIIGSVNTKEITRASLFSALVIMSAPAALRCMLISAPSIGPGGTATQKTSSNTSSLLESFVREKRPVNVL